MRHVTWLSLLVWVSVTWGAPPRTAAPQPASPREGTDRLFKPFNDGPPIECDPNDPADRAKYGLDDRLAIGLRDALAVTTVIDNGPVANRVDIVFLGDGYTLAELSDYANDVDYVLAEFFVEPPFDAYAGYFNVHRVEVISNESGVDEPDLGIYKDTALDMSYGINSRLISVNLGKAIDAASYAPDADQMLAMANHSRWGGSGYYFQDMGTFPGKNSLSYEVALHEFGHSFGNLADEYVEYYGLTYGGGEPWQANVSKLDAAGQLAQQAKWYRWLDHPDVDTFEGAYYYQYGVYRSSYSSKMRSTGAPYREVNVEQLVRLIYEAVSPIDDATPPSAVPLLAGSSLFVTPMQPAEHNLDVQWSVDGAPVSGATGVNFTPDYGALPDGIHTVSVEVVDNTTRVRDENIRANLLTATRSWSVQGSWPGVPTGLLATAGPTSVQLDWDDNPEPDIAYYNIYRATTPGGPYSLVDTALQSAYEDTAVTAGTTYYYVVTAYAAGNESGYSNEDFGTPGVPPPSTPANFTATAGETVVFLDWHDNPEPNIAGYKLFRSTTSGGPYTLINATLLPDSEYNDTGLTNDTTYYYVVLARDTGGNESALSPEVSATPVDLPPAAPTNLVATAGERSVFLDWDDNTEPDFQDYCIYISETSGGPYDEIDCDDPSYWPVNWLTDGVTYYFVVLAEDWGGNQSAFSNEASATPQNMYPPAPPEGLTADERFESIFLDWEDNSEPDIWTYRVYISETSGGPYDEVDSDDVSEFLVSGLINDVTYYFVVTAIDTGFLESDFSEEIAATPDSDAPPSAPTGLTATAGDGYVFLDWNDNPEPDVVEYRIYQSRYSGGPYDEVDADDPSEFTVYGLTNGYLYYFVVTAVDAGGHESGYSSQVSATPRDSIPPAAPTNLVAWPLSGGVFLDWDDNPEPDIQDYFVYWSFTSGGPYEELDSDNVSEWIALGLANGTTYYWVVAVTDTSGNFSDFSNEASATPEVDPPPVPPRYLESSAEDYDLIYLSWMENYESDVDHYNIYRSISSGGLYTLAGTSLYGEFEDTVSPGVTYYHVVTAVDDSDQESAYSNEVSATTPIPLLPPTGVAAWAGDGVVIVSWSEVYNPIVAGYGVYRSTTSGGPYQAIGSTQQTSFQDHTVENGTTYYYVVVCIGGGQDESDYSEEVSATPTGGCTSPAECDDGAFCNGAEDCVAGDCVAGTPVDCNDGIACTVDSCNEAADTCDNIPNDAACDDGQYCNGTEICDVDLDCLAGTPVDCDDGVDCTEDICNESTDACENNPDDLFCDDGLFCNGEETCHATLDCQPGVDPCGGESCNEADDTCGAGAELWIVFTADVSVPGVGTVANEDIVAYDTGAGTWSLVFDGSDVGLGSLAINGMAVLSDGDILLTFTSAANIAGMSVDDSDIVRFTPTSLGSTTSGTFSFYFDGSDVGLTKNAENIDAIGLTASGDLILSTTGNFAGNGASGVDEDLFVFNATSLGSSTSGSFAMYFDGGDVGLTRSDEDIDAAGLTTSGSILLSTLGDFSVTGASGADEDIFEFSPTSLGSSTSGTFQMYLDLSAAGISTTADVIAVELIE